MIKPKRYLCGGYVGLMHEFAKGDWVNWSDYAILQAEVERLQNNCDYLDRQLDREIEKSAMLCGQVERLTDSQRRAGRTKEAAVEGLLVVRRAFNEARHDRHAGRQGDSDRAAAQRQGLRKRHRLGSDVSQRSHQASKLSVAGRKAAQSGFK